MYTHTTSTRMNRQTVIGKMIYRYKFELELIARSLHDLRLRTILSNCGERENGRR